ncbi:MAG: YajQ family cyclic di-GMP-binding protein [Actinobacteria bacterium]|nr:YajQ family cyclic di-GMP-binding protein [Actinomycetota bacterium]
MSKENSFDIVSRVDLQEIDNTLNQVMKEIRSRFDFKGSKCSVEFSDGSILMHADNDFKLKSLVDILEAKAVKRGINLKSFRYGKIEKASGDTVRQKAEVVQGVDKELGREIIKLVKEAKLKVQASIQEDQVRVTGKNRDDLQKVIQLIKDRDWEIPLQFVNMRTF